ncbi:MAG: PHP domain-containing protein [Candidatus Woesearchaeota archaeon]
MTIKQVYFNKPNIKTLNKNGFLCVDMHCHTHYSDGISLKKIIKRAKKIGIGLAITDHNEIGGALEAAKQKDIFIIPGIEINCIDGPHLLCYFYDTEELEKFYSKEIEKYKTKMRFAKIIKLPVISRKSYEVVKSAKDYNCLVSLAHPYGYIHMNIEKALFKDHYVRETIKGVDAFEVITSNQKRISNIRAYALQILLNKCVTAGSDAHTIYDLGSALTCAKAKSAEDFLESIKFKTNIVVGKSYFRKKVAFTTGLLKRKSGQLQKIITNKVKNLIIKKS